MDRPFYIGTFRLEPVEAPKPQSETDKVRQFFCEHMRADRIAEIPIEDWDKFVSDFGGL